MDSRSPVYQPREDGVAQPPAYRPIRVRSVRVSEKSSPPRAQRRDDLLSPETQIVRNRADYLAEGQDDVGQRIADDKLELFVSNEPAQAMLQQFTQLTPDFIVLHDVGGSGSLRLLNAIATALKTKLQQLAIRRAGHGVALATLPFVDLPGRGSQKLRVYTTDIDTDSHSRRALASVLLGHSRLGVLMVGELPVHALGNALQPVREAILKGPWPNRELLLVPHGNPGALAAQAAALTGPPGLNVRVTPQAHAPNEAWGYVTGAWNRLRETRSTASASASKPTPAYAPASSPDAASATQQASRADAATEPMPMPVPQATTSDLTPGRWDAYLQACLAIKGLVSACVFDFRTVKALAHSGARPDPDRLTAQGRHLFEMLAESSRALGLGPSQPDAAITLTGHHLLLHPLPGHPGIILHAVLDASIANLTLARMQLQRIDTTLLAASTPYLAPD